MRRVLVILAGLLAVGIVVYSLWSRSPRPAVAGGRPVARDHGVARASAPAAAAAVPLVPGGEWEAEFPIAARLNAPSGTITKDLDALSQILDAWRSNFPGEGNPVGENAEIAAALAGDNRLELALVPKRHPAFNAAGELCDRWGTPFRFHQLSGDRMEIRSAGPDRTFATADDAVWMPQ